MSNPLEFGQNGTHLDTAATTSATGAFSVIKADSGDATITATVNWQNAPNPITINLVQGEETYGVFTSVTVTSGKVICYE